MFRCLDHSNLITMFPIEEELQWGHTGSAEGSEGEDRNLAAELQISYSLLRGSARSSVSLFPSVSYSSLKTEQEQSGYNENIS